MLASGKFTYLFLNIKSKPPITSSSGFNTPSTLITVITSSISPIFNAESYGVLAVIDGPPFTSRSQALPSESNRKSKP